ncbi:MAG TPA: glycosyl hydrolase 108 family protein [Rhodanobacteraceae bacterium]
MANFSEFLPQLLRFEGGYVDDPADPGGATNKGITMQTFVDRAPAILGIEPTPQAFRALTDQQAGTIYKNSYWDLVGGDWVTLQPLADMVCDFYVNAGANAVRTLQQVLNAKGVVPALTVDGVFGPATLRWLLSVDQADVYRRLKQGRIDYYRGLVERDPALGKFLDGWLNRVNAFPDL